MPRPIVLAAVDLKAISRRVLFHAAGMARVLDADLKIVHVNRRDTSAHAVEACLTLTPYEIPLDERDIYVRSGRVSDVILREALDLNACLIVAGSRGSRDITRFILGSTCKRLLQSARTPLLLVPPQDFDIVGISDRAVLSCGPIVAAVDLDSASTNQLWIAAGVAELAHQRLVVMTVAPSRVSSEEALLRLHERTYALPTSLEKSIVIRRGRIADQIARSATAEGAGLVVMGLCERRGHRGAIADAVLRTGRAFVLAVAEGAAADVWTAPSTRSARIAECLPPAAAS